jgi:hypothetical protein
VSDVQPVLPPQFRPIEGDPSAPMVEAMFDARSGDWILTAEGDYQSAAVEVLKADGSAVRKAVILEWPGRRNHSDELVTVRLMMAPDDAIGLADILVQSGRWLKAMEERERGEGK